MTHYPLTKAQMGVYLECAKHPESTQYNNPWSTLLDPVLDLDKVEQAIINIFNARKELHLHFTEGTDGTVCQYVSDAQLTVKRLDMTEDEAVRYQKEYFCRPFVLNGDEPLIRAEILVTEKHRYLLVDLHHLIADGTTDLFLFSHRDLSDAYEGKELKEYGYGLLDYAKEEAAQYAGSAYERDKTFYQNRFSGMTFATLSDGSEKEGRILFSSEMLSKDAIEDFCTQNEVAANIVFQAAFGYTLSVLLGEEKIMYIIENHGRYTKELSQSYGMFVNNTPVLSTINDKLTVSEYLDQVRGEALLGMRHSHYPFLDLCSDMGVSTGAVFNFLAMEEVEESSFFGDKKCPFVQLNRNAAFSDLGVTIFKTPDNYEIRATSGEFQNSERILRLFTHAMKTVVLKIIEAPDSKITALSLVPDNETDKVLAVSEGDELVYEKDKTWVDLFCENVNRNPDAVAVKDAYSSFTYEELDKASDKVARYLIQKDVKNNDFVAVKIKRIKEFVAAVLGINKAGAAYVPIDPEYPEERISYMITDSDAKCVITKESMTEILAMDDGSEPFVSRAKADDLAYMIYTSGTSGRPKGAMILHKGLRAFCAWNNQELKQNSTTSHLIQSSFSFDASVFDMIPPLVAGATIHIADESLRTDLPVLAEYINRNDITGLLVNTQIGMELIDHYDLKLSYLMLGGDKMLPVKTSSFTVYNAYGPTEFTAASSFYKVKGGESVIPIGRPVPGSASLICDRYGNLLPLGATGELCLLGIQMGAGYYNQPELTRRKFIKRNIRGNGEETLYRTGDLARYNEDGNLEFLGRIDSQIKLRGYRIELGEIESVAAWYEGVTGAVALLRNDAIVLYYTATKQIDKEKLRDFLSGKLTEYMVPAVLMQLDEMPLTPGGKIDQKALPEPEYERKTAYEEPKTATEKIISAFMAKILRLGDKVGRKDNFYELGGDSIMAIRLVSMLRQEGVNIRTTWILQSKSVAELAMLCDNAGQETGGKQEESFTGAVGDSAIIKFFKLLNLPNPMHFDQSVLLRLEDDIDINLLESSLKEIVRLHDILRAVWKDEGLIVENKDTSIQIKEYYTATEKEITDICSSLKGSFKEGASLIRAAVISHNKNTDMAKRYLFLTAHHTIVDGVSWRIILDDLADAYHQLKENRKAVLPEETISYADYVNAQKSYADSYALSLEIPYWRRVQEQVLGLSDKKTENYTRVFGLFEEKLESDATTEFLAAPFDRIKGTVEDGLLTAVCMALFKHKGINNLSVRMEGHGREEFVKGLLPEQTVGWFTSVYPVVIENITEDLLKDLLTVKECIHRVPQRGVGYGILQYLSDSLSEHDPVPQISFNYLGVMEAGIQNGVFTFETDIDTGRDMAEENTFGCALSINCMVASGHFTLRLEYDKANYTDIEIKELASEVFENMGRIVSLLKKETGKTVTASDLGETKWSQEEFDSVYRKYRSKGEDIQRIYPLTSMQEAMLLKAISEPGSHSYKMAYIFELGKALTAKEAERALDRLADKYEVLRTAISYRNVSEPRQMILKRKPFLVMKDIRGALDPEKEILRIREEVLEDGFDLENKPLFGLIVVKKTDESCYIIMSVHHIIIDGWCLRPLLSDLSRFLIEESVKEQVISDSDLKSMDGIYERAVRESLLLDRRKGLEYFKNLLDGYDSLAEIPSFGEVPLNERSDTNEVVLTIDKESTDDLLKLCKLSQVTISNAVELAWGRVLSVCSRQPDVVFAKTVSGRDKTGEDVTDIVGLFIRSVPVRIVFTEDKNTIQMLGEIREQASCTNEYDYCAMSEIQEQTNHGRGLFQSILTFENYNSGLDAADISADKKSALKVILIKDENFDDISPVSYVDDKGQLTFKLLFDTSKYRREEMNRCLKLFKLTVSQMVKYPEKPLIKMPVLDKQEEKKVIEFSKSEALDYDRNSTWISVFNRAVRNYPKNTAVVDDSGSLTYEELDRQSDALCVYLSDHNVKPGDFVALKMPHVKEFITAVIGIHKAGAAYVPIDTEYPSERISFMLKDCEAVLTLDDIKVKEAVADYEGRSANDLSKPDQIAYMIYTSGSTGHPKGVMFLQSGLMNCASAIVLENELRSTDRIGLHFSFSFDSHIEDTYPPLMSGATIYMMPENIRKDPDAIYRFLEKNAITGCGFTTSLARLMIENYDLHLRYISPMGEALTEVGSDTVRILNKYGPTECCICSVYELKKSRKYKDVPIGRALPNSYIFIVDEKGHLLPKGMAGELCYAGPQVGAGYWKQEEMTGRVFTDCPFVSGIKMYHTGDLARYDEDGNLWFLGRIDLQVKVNGYRVEISEIESCALQNESVYEAAAVIRDNRIHLFYTVKGKGISPEEIKSKMSSFLPGYMVPEGFFELDSMPHTPSGKIDRKALIVPKEHISEEMILPRTPMEKLVHGVCLELLHGQSISVTANLISCGLSSIGAMRLGIMLSGRTGSHVDIPGIMRSPTIESIAAMLTKPQEDVHIHRYQERKYYPIASNQLAIYLEWDKDRLSTKYNVPYLYILEGIDAEAFKRAVLEAVSVHPYLNNRFILRDAEPVQMPGDEAITVTLEHLTKEPDMTFFQNMVRPFDLLQDCLSRFGIYSFENKTYFFIDIHHSIYDGLSMTILMQDILKAYNGESLEAEAVSSYDAAIYEEERLGKELSFRAQEFFDAQLKEGESAVFPESEEKDNIYQSQETLRIDRKNIDSFCKESGVTASSFLQAAFAEALYRYTKAEKPVYLTVTNGREDEALGRTVGMFIHTVPVSCGIENRQSMSAADYVKEMHGRLQDIYAFGYYPWSKLTSEYKISPEIMFVYQDDIFEGGQLNGSRQIPLLLDSLKYPICLTAFPEGDDYVLYFEYDGNKYNKKDIQAFGNSIRCIAAGLSENRKLKDCKNLDPEEEKEIITLSTGDDLQFDSSKTWVDLFKENVEIYPDDIAIVDSTGRNTYKELDIQSDKVAAFLIDLGVKENDFVAVKMGRIKEFVAAILGVNKAGAAYIPVDPTYPEDRITYMLKDSEAKHVLTDENIFKILKDVSVESSLVSRAKAENKAYMIYTSGTTGRPKGAMILHRGLSAFVAWNNQEFKQGRGSKHLIQPSFSFDASVFDMICPLAAGATVHIAGEDLRRDLSGLTGYINENQITGMLVSTQVGMELIGHYDLNLRYMMLGGDKMLPLRDTNYNVYNAYGPTEFTVASSFYKVSGGEKTVPIGRPVPGSISIICDRYGNLLPKGVAGELCVAGIQMGAGYFNQPLLTAEKFVNLEIPGTGETTVFRTGDLARYNKEGNLLFLGRIDDQIKLRGYRIELGEIENTAASYEDITGVAALAKNDSIVLYYTSDKEVDEQELRSFLGKKLPEYMVPEIYMELKTIPLRENGKIDRGALPDPLLNDNIVLQEPETDLEIKLFEITKALLGKDGYGVTSNLIRMGLSSLGAMRLSSQIQRKLGMTLKVADILKNPTIREMAKSLETEDGTGNNNSGHIKIYEKRQYYPITENQKGLYIEWELHKNTLQYNDPEVYILKDRSISEVEAAVISVINAHSYLKVHLTLIDGEVMQKRSDEDEIIIGKEKLSYEPDESFFKGKVRPFDLLSDTLYRIELTEYRNSVFLFMDIHHIISDGLTVSMLMQEVVKALDGKEISQEELTAYDFALDEEEWGRSDEFVKAQEYFDSILEGAEPANLSGSDTPEGSGIGVIRTTAPKDKIDAFLRANNVTAASYLQAAFAETLYRLLRTEKLFYVTISNGRSGDARLDHAAGMFVKTIPVVRSEDKLKDVSLTSDYVKAIHRQLGASFEKERYPYTRMVDRSGLHASILFSYQGGIYDELIKDESVSGHITVERDTARFPIEVLSAEMNDEYIFELSYDRSIYSRKDMEMFCAAVANAAEDLAECKNRTDLSLADTREREKLLRLGEGQKLYVDPEETIVSMFNDRAAKKPDDKALVYKDKSYTYGEIDTITDYLALYLVREANVRSGDVVGVLIERSEYMLIYPMAIMKAGAAYMPLDPSFPEERLMFMCEDASVKVILTDNDIANRVIPDYRGTVIERGKIENAGDLTITHRGDKLPKVSANDPMVVLYTSGSTGQPKGVTLLHAGIVNFMHWYIKEYDVTEKDRAGAYAAFGFDAHMIDLYSSVLAGACVYIISDELRKDLQELNRYYKDNGITISFMTTQVACLFSEINKTLRVLTTGGEKMPPVKNPGYRFINGYGPTECSIYTTTYEVKDAFDGRYIGRPLPNYQLYVTDPYGRLLPEGAGGELLISGVGVGAGYLNSPELTKEKFISLVIDDRSAAIRAYRTGDLVRWSESGNLEFLGRLDNQVKLRGLRIELGEIENRASMFEGITSCAASVIKDAIVLYYTSDTEVDKKALVEFLGRKLADYMVPQKFVHLDTMPIGTNGKIERSALPDPESDSIDYVDIPETKLQKDIQKLVSSIIKTDNPGVNSNLIRMGMSSLGAMRLSVLLQKELGVTIKMSDILSDPTIKGIAARLKDEEEVGAETIRAYEKREYYPITENQRGIYLDWELNRDSLQYNLPILYLMNGQDMGRLADAIEKAINAHSYLKTRFVFHDGDIMQKRCDDEACVIHKECLTFKPDRDYFLQKVRPFDLREDSLYRIELSEYQDTVYLFMDMHHIVFDGLSSKIFMNDIMLALEGTIPESESVTAYDYALYEKELEKRASYKEAHEYFAKLIMDAHVMSYPNSVKPDGGGQGSVITDIDSKPVEEAGRKYEVTAGAFLQAAFAETISRFMWEENPLYLTISNGRNGLTNMDRTVGMFVKTVPVVYNSSGSYDDRSIRDYVNEFQDQLQQTYRREFYPYTKLVEESGLKGEILYVYQGGVREGSEMGGAEVIDFEFDSKKFPLQVTVYPQDDRYVFRLDYDGNRYSKEDMEILAEAIKEVALSMAEGNFGRYNEDGIPEYTGHMDHKVRVHGHCVEFGEIEGAAGGKVDVKALPEPAKDDVGENIAPETELEKKLFDIAARQLETDKFGITTSLISMGLSSLGIMRLSMNINQELGVAPLVRDMMNDPTIRGIASHLEVGLRDKDVKTNGIGTYEQREYYPITENQRGLYIDWELNENTLQYNVPVVYILKGRSIPELENAINAVMDAHSYLKMHLVAVDGELMQKRCDEDPVIIKKEVLGNEPTKDYFQKKVRPFKLLEDNLYRFELSEYKDMVYLFMDMHHIIFDGLTSSLFIDELQKKLDGSSVPKEKITAFDFALFEKEQTASDEFAKAAEYFEDLLKGAEAAYIEKSDEPDGETLGIADTYLSRKEIDEFCKANDVTPSSFFEAAFAETLYRMTREEKLAYVTVSNGRSADARLERTAGMFVKTIPVVRNEEELKGVTLSADYVRSIHRQLQNSFTRELYPYTRIVEKNGIHARILFTYQGEIFDESVTNEETIGHFDMELDTAKFPVEVFVCPVNEKYLIHISYDGRLYSHKDMQLLAGAIANAASEMAVYEELNCISLADQSMRLMLKELGEGSKMALDSGETIVSMFRRRASETPDVPAVVYNGRSFTYGELDALTDALALTLVTEKNVNPGDIVGVLIHRSEYMLIYPLAIMKAGAAYMPLDPGFPSERLQFMCEDANVKLIMTESGLGKDLLPEFKGIVFDRGNSDISAGLQKKENTHNAEVAGLPEVNAKDAMVILYTSGSTGLPKAVALPHKGIVNFMHWYVNEYEVSEKDRAGAYANFGFDAHMIDLYSSVLAGACVYIIPDEMRMNLSEINRYYEENSITISFMTTQVACIFSEMNKSLRVLTTGGEKMPRVKNPGYRLINGYGPTECSIYTTTYEVNGEFDGRYIGRPISNYQVFVADCKGKLLPRGFAGELVISGAGIGDGYLNRPELTDEKFILFKTDINAAPVRAYRTGDLVRWSEDGNLEFLGRLDNQVKLRGLRIELGEIENRAASYEGIMRAAAAVIDDTIVLYYTCEKEIDEEALKSFLGRMLTDYMVPQIYVHMDIMPVNANGKIDRLGLPKPMVTEGEELHKPSTELEEKLFNLIRSHFANCEFGVTTSLIRMGLTSLGAMRLSVLLQKELGRTLKMSEILSAPTIRAMAEKLEAKDSQEKGSIKTQTLRDHYPITENQKGLYIDWELHRDTLQYNVPVVYVFKGRSLQKVADALKAVFEAHKYLMTRFGIVDGSVCQIPATAEAVRSIDISVKELDSEPQREYFQKKVRPFDILSEPLYRAELSKYRDTIYLFLDIHHIIYDGLTSAVLIQEILEALEGKPILGEELSAYDYALFEEEWMESDSFKEGQEYYDTLLAGAEALIYPDSENCDGHGSGFSKAFVSRQLVDDFCRENSVTAASFLQAAFAETMFRLTRIENLVYASVSNGRGVDSRLDRTAGMFVRTIPVVRRQLPDMEEIMSAEYVRSFHDQLGETFTHELYPYTHVVERSRIHPEILFGYQGGLFENGITAEDENNEPDRFKVTQISLDLDTVKFPMEVYAYPDGDSYYYHISYDGTRYGKKDMERLTGTIALVADEMAKDRKMSDISLVSRETADELIKLGRGENLFVDPKETIVSMFRNRATAAPQSKALVYKDRSYTYNEIEKQSDILASYLVTSVGVKPGDIVGVLIGRSEYMMIYPLAIMKAKAAYMPMDPHFPTDRLIFMCEDAGVKVLLTGDTDEKKSLPGFKGTIIDYDTYVSVLAATDKAKDIQLPEVQPQDTMVILYTSGSTGKPKAVELAHKGIVNYMHWFVKKFEVTEKDRPGAYSNFAFDAHMIELYSSVLAGACVYIVPEEVRKEPDKLNSFYEDNGITISFMTTLLGCLFSRLNKTLRVLITGGEKMSHVTAPDYRMVHAYGPTECSIFATTCEIEGEFDGKNIGRPLDNYQIFVTDPYRKLLPVGEVGELLIGGVGVAKGYLNRKELTDEKFIIFKADEASYPVKVYRTGDLVRMCESGNLEFVGRLDNQIKLRGLRIELGEIESRMEAHGNVKGAVAIVKNDAIVLYYASDEIIDEDELKDFLSKTLPDYMVPEIFVHLDSIPVNANGKTDKGALPEPSFDRKGRYIRPETDIEWAIAESMQKVLGIKEPVGALDNFFELGGDSIKAIRIITELRNREITVSVADIMKEKTIRRIASCATLNDHVEISQEPVTGEIEDTPIICFFKELRLPVPSHFNQSMLLACKKMAVPTLLQMAVDALVQQHDLLRSVWVNEHLFVKDTESRILLEEYSAYSEDITNICNEVQSGIRMDKALFRVVLIHNDDKDFLLLVAHHLIVDGVSWRILLEDLEIAYSQLLRGESVTLPPKTNTYMDYSKAVRSFRNSYRLSLEKDYWDETQKTLLLMPTTNALDYTRPMKQKSIILGKELTDQILHKDLTGHNLEINDILLTAVCVSFASVIGEEKMSVQMEGHGREDLGTQLLIDRTIGWFTSIYPVIVDGIETMSSDKNNDTYKEETLSHDLMTVKETLRRVPGKGVGYNILRTIDGDEEADYSFERIAEIGFNYLGEMNVTEEAGKNEGVFFSAADISAGKNLAKENIFGPDLAINCSASNGRFVWILDYNSSKYSDEQADEFLKGIESALNSLRLLIMSNNMTDELTASDLGETEWSIEEFRTIVKDFESRGEKILRIYPLTPMQEGMLLKHLEDPKDWAYRIVNYFEIDMVPTKEQLIYAMDKMKENNEVLKTAIIHDGVSISRQALIERPSYVEMIDISDSTDPEMTVEEIRKDILTGAFDLQKKPLAQLYCAVHSEESCYIIIAVHHAIIDGWSFQLFIDQFFDYLDESLEHCNSQKD